MPLLYVILSEMKSSRCGLAFLLGLGAVAAGTAFADAADVCSHDTLSVDGTAVAVLICATEPAKPVPSGKTASLPVTESLSTKDQSFGRTTTLDFLGGEELSRTIDNVPLAKLGIPKTLHLTLAHKAGSLALEHALLIPGAVTLK
jgi:hypothetical protein